MRLTKLVMFAAFALTLVLGIGAAHAQQKLYWGEGSKIQRANLDGSDAEAVFFANSGKFLGIAVDLAARKLYWTNADTKKIQRADLDGSNVEDLVTFSSGTLGGIALDVASGKMYWTDALADKIQRANLDGSTIELLVTGSLVDGPSRIALDVSGGKMYWTELGGRKIQRANLDGSNIEQLVAITIESVQPHGIALDVSSGKMYWAIGRDSGGDAKIQRANLNGSGVEELVTAGTHLSAGLTLDLGRGKMYWTNDTGQKIMRSDLDGSHVEDLVATRSFFRPTAIALHLDCNDNRILDERDVADGISEDCNNNVLPDECEPDCNNNGSPDTCDITGGNSLDHNGTRVPDECETVIFVDAEAIGLDDGTSWANAYSELQDALAAAPDPAVPFTLIWVAQGTYRPTARTDPADPRSATFQLASGVQLFGGFSGGETRLEQRIRATNVTILSGDLSGENSYHVVTAGGTDSTAILDGFKIIGGNANEFSEGKGGGMSIPDGDPIVSHCRFTSNAALSGGGMFIGLASPIIESCVFTGNVAADWGGGVYDRVGYTTPYIASLFNCVFSGNSAGGRGGGMNVHRANATLSNCVFFGNTAGDFGGGISVISNVFTATSCIFWGNSDGTGGGESAQIDTSRRPKYSLIQGWTAKLGDVGNIGDDPRFVDPDGPDDIVGTEDDNLRLLPDSPAINAGDTAFVPEPRASDLDGHGRVLCGRRDMGAFEFGIGDFNCDRTVDLTDFADWSACMTGPGNGRTDSGCEAFDFEADADVDLKDFAGVQTVFGS